MGNFCQDFGIFRQELVILGCFFLGRMGIFAKNWYSWQEVGYFCQEFGIFRQELVIFLPELGNFWQQLRKF